MEQRVMLLHVVEHPQAHLLVFSHIHTQDFEVESAGPMSSAGSWDVTRLFQRET